LETKLSIKPLPPLFQGGAAVLVTSELANERPAKTNCTGQLELETPSVLKPEVSEEEEEKKIFKD